MVTIIAAVGTRFLRTLSMMMQFCPQRRIRPTTSSQTQWKKAFFESLINLAFWKLVSPYPLFSSPPFLSLTNTSIVQLLESDMCDVIKIRPKRRMQREVGKETMLNIKTALEWPILKQGLSNFRLSFYFTSRWIPHF